MIWPSDSGFGIASAGPAGAGKGTLARRLADHYHLHLLDTGLTYRAVAYALLSQGLPLHDEAKAMLANFDSWSIRHVKRAQNADADKLVNEALDNA